MNNNPSMKWYDFYTFYTLYTATNAVIAIPLILFMTVFYGAIFGFIGVAEGLDAYVSNFIGFFIIAMLVSLMSCAVNAAINITAYRGLKKMKKTGLYMVYLQNIFIPVGMLISSVILIPVQIRTMHETSWNYSANYYSGELAMYNNISIIVMVITILFMLITYTVLYSLNSLYFYKRRHLFN